jgi:hypothetical protein
MKSNTGERLYRYNLLLADAESAWLDQLADEIRQANGAKVSRSEIVRAAIAGLRELYRLAPERPSKFVALTHARTGSDLALMTILAARLATTEAP